MFLSGYEITKISAFICSPVLYNQSVWYKYDISKTFASEYRLWNKPDIVFFPQPFRIFTPGWSEATGNKNSCWGTTQNRFFQGWNPLANKYKVRFFSSPRPTYFWGNLSPLEGWVLKRLNSQEKTRGIKKGGKRKKNEKRKKKKSKLRPSHGSCSEYLQLY